MKQFQIGLQLFSVCREMEKDMAQTLKKVKEMGYDYVEFAGYYGKEAKEVRQLLDDTGLKCISVHQNAAPFLTDGQKIADDIKILGAPYCAIPWCDPKRLKGSDLWEETVEQFIRMGEILKDNNIQLLYHNHDFEFASREGKLLLEWILETVGEDMIFPELDTCWVKYAGQDVLELLKRYTGRIPLLHLKDFVTERYPQNETELGAAYYRQFGLEFCSLGQGVQDFTSILTAAEAAGVEYLIVEQDPSEAIPPMEAVRQSREYLKTFGL